MAPVLPISLALRAKARALPSRSRGIFRKMKGLKLLSGSDA